MKKSEIITLIQSMLTGNASKTTRANHENYVHTDSASILNETYKTTYITDTNSSTNVFEEVDSDFTYNLQVKKQGGFVTVGGYVRNTKNIAVPMLTGLVKITNDEYLPQAGMPILALSGEGFGNWDVTGLSMEFGVSDVTIRTSGVLFSNETLNVNFTYFVGE